MPDLTIESGVWCASNEHWEIVLGQNAKLHHEHTVTYGRTTGMHQPRYDYSCTCKSFQFRRKPCKHIEMAKQARCAWNEEMEPGGTETECPNCGGPTVGFRVGV
jgi:hypothetical protein